MSLQVGCSSRIGRCPRRREAFTAKRLSECSRRRTQRQHCCRKGFPNQPGTNELKNIFPDTPKQRRRRVVLKISGEALQGPETFGIDPEVLKSIAQQIADCHKDGYQIAVVVGGGNFFRGADAFEGIDRVTADYVGMLATTMNAICLHSMLESFKVESRLQTALEIREVAEPYIRQKAIRHLEKQRVVVFGAGTGNPFFTTDMAAVLRAAEIDADEVLKATKVDGVYSCDPSTDDGAEFLKRITYDQALRDELQFMDGPAVSLCKDCGIPIRVFNLLDEGNIAKAIRGDPVGSVADCNGESVQKSTPAEELEDPQDKDVNSNGKVDESITPSTSQLEVSQKKDVHVNGVASQTMMSEKQIADSQERVVHVNGSAPHSTTTEMQIDDSQEKDVFVNGETIQRTVPKMQNEDSQTQDLITAV